MHEDKSESPGPAILIKNLETLASVSPFSNVDLGITVVSVLPNTCGSTLGREKAHFRGENSVTYKSQDFSRKFERNSVCFNDL